MSTIRIITCVLFAITTTNGCNVTLCPPLMSVGWLQMPPYVNSNTNDTNTTHNRMLPTVLRNIAEDMMRTCCGKCVQFQYESPQLNQETLGRYINARSSNSSLNFPVSGQLESTKYNYFPYFPLVHSPGFIFFQNKWKVAPADGVVADAVGAGWPIMVLSLVMATLSGVVIWLMDTWWNAEQFPRFFANGMWEGKRYLL